MVALLSSVYIKAEQRFLWRRCYSTMDIPGAYMASILLQAFPRERVLWISTEIRNVSFQILRLLRDTALLTTLNLFKVIFVRHIQNCTISPWPCPFSILTTTLLQDVL